MWKLRLRSLVPIWPTLRCRVTGVQTLSALCVTCWCDLLSTVLSACTPRSWLVSPTRTMWRLCDTVSTTPWKSLVRVLRCDRNRTPLSPAMFLISLVMLVLKLCLRLVWASVALLTALRRTVVVSVLELRCTLVSSLVIVIGRATQGLLSPWARGLRVVVLMKHVRCMCNCVLGARQLSPLLSRRMNGGILGVIVLVSVAVGFRATLVWMCGVWLR